MTFHLHHRGTKDTENDVKTEKTSVFSVSLWYNRMARDRMSRMNLERFAASPSGRLVQATHGAVVYQAFVPHPLPPVLPLDADLWRRLSEADRALGELAGLGRTLPNPHLLINPLLRREAVLSSRIEGTVTGIAELYAYEAIQLALPGIGVESRPPTDDVREVFNYVRALELGIDHIQAADISLWLILALHRQLMEGVRGGQAAPGEFRRIPNVIGRPGSTLTNARFVPPPVIEMHAALAALEGYLRAPADADYPPLVRLALIHYQFEAIHPFEDGNGRTGRLLISLLPVHWKLLPQPLLHLSAFLDRYQEAYRDLLLAVSQDGAWYDWVMFFLQAVAEQAADAVQRARQLQDLREDWRTIPNTTPLTLRLIDTLFIYPVVSAPSVRDQLAISYPAAQKHIKKLVAAGILHPAPETAGVKTYVAQAILDVLLEDSP